MIAVSDHFPVSLSLAVDSNFQKQDDYFCATEESSPQRKLPQEELDLAS